MLELQSTDSETGFGRQLLKIMDSLLFYSETVCSHNSKSILSKNTILFSKRCRHDDRWHFPCCNINTSPYATGGSTKKFSSVAQSCLTLCDPMDFSMPGFPVHHQLLECTQTHVHCICNAIQPSHSLSSPSPPAFNLSQHQGLFKWVSSLHKVAKVLEFQL